MEQSSGRVEEGGLGCVGVGMVAASAARSNSPHEPVGPTWVSLALCLLNSGHRTKESYWRQNGITWGKGANAHAEETRVAAGCSGRHFDAAASPGAAKVRIRLSVT